MNVNLTSNSNLFQAASSAQLRSRIDTLQAEISSGVLQNVGQVLGLESRNLISAYQERNSIAGYRSNISSASRQLEAISFSLASLNDLVEDLKQNLVAVQSDTSKLVNAYRISRAFLEQLPNVLTAGDSSGNALLGQNGSDSGILNYLEVENSSARQKFLDVFMLHFGGAPSTVDMSAITAQQMSNFTDAFVTSYEDEASWSSDWTGGTIDPKRIHLGKADALGLPTLTALSSLRSLTAMAVVLVELGATSLNLEARNALTEASLNHISSAQYSLTGYRTYIGEVQDRVNTAGERMSKENELITRQINAVEGIDQVSAISELSSLKSQLELSYTMTSYLSNLLLANYIR